MNILQVHNTANIPQLLAKTLRKLGVNCDFFESTAEVDVRNYDIVHGHYALNKSTIKAFLKCKKYNVPFVLHCHGSDVRLLKANGMVKLPLHLYLTSKFLRKCSDLCEFSEGIYLPNPVDLEMFKPMSIEKSDRILICGKQIKGSNLLDYIEKDKEYDCVDFGCLPKLQKNVRIIQRVPYEELPFLLNKYRFMIGTIGDPVSMTRLCAMACGLKTFTNFPEKYTSYYNFENPDRVSDPRKFIEKYHDPMKICKYLIDKYSEIINER
ncbi:MAG: hypothetical protein QMC98_00865 [Candidatus Thermoplasmatota archaeon]|nr:hypothetical protein [Candidatus Thermoplasmatota archaeon]